MWSAVNFDERIYREVRVFVVDNGVNEMLVKDEEKGKAHVALLLLCIHNQTLNEARAVF